MTSTETVVLVDQDGTRTGTADKAAVHTTDTPLHLAFSCHLLDEAGQVLVTRRALSKKTWPGVWTNSVCGHPGPDESFEDAVRRRCRHELGVEVRDITLVDPDFRYRAVDPSGIVEHEICPVFTARTVGPLSPRPDEVMDHAWVPVEHLRQAVRIAPWALSPWLVASAATVPMLRGSTA